MLELALRSGSVITFDGVVLEIFDPARASSRFHVAQLGAPQSVETADGARTLSLGDGSITLSFAREEAPACARLLAAIAGAQH
jgi:hypothetical protein